jgi:hypothetical protein
MISASDDLASLASVEVVSERRLLNAALEMFRQETLGLKAG